MVTPLILIPSMTSSFPPGEHHPIYHYPTISGRTTAHNLDVQLPTLSGIIIPPLSGFAHLLSSKNYSPSKKQPAKPQLDWIDTKCAEIEFPLSQRIVPYTSSPSPTSAASNLTDSIMSAMGTQPPSVSFSEFHSREDKNMAMSTLDIGFSHPPNRGDVSMFDSPRPSPSQRTIPPGCTGEDDDIDVEDAWNLVPYNIAWGPSYYGYKKGTLPGPDGKSIFLRSPTPLKNQRTGQACEKCRERKAKCSGSRPSCARCIARGHTCEYGPEIKKTKHDAEGSDSEQEYDDEEDPDDSDQQMDVDAHTSSPPSSVAKTLLARRPTATTRKRRNTESAALPSQSVHRRPGVRRHSVLNPSRDVSSPTDKKRRIASYSPQQKLSPNSDVHYLRTPEGSSMPSPFSDSSDAGSFFSLPSYPNSAMSSPLTPLGASQEPLGGGSYLAAPSFGSNFGSAMDVDVSTGISYLDTQSLRVVDASQFSTFDSRPVDATFYVHGVSFAEGMKFSDSPALPGHYANQISIINNTSHDIRSIENDFSGQGLGLENADNIHGNGIPQLQVTDFDSSTRSIWPSSAVDQPAEAFDELAFLAQLAQLPANIFDFKQER